MRKKIVSLVTAIAVMSGMLCGCAAENAKETFAEPTSANETFDVSAIRA